MYTYVSLYIYITHYVHDHPCDVTCSLQEYSDEPKMHGLTHIVVGFHIYIHGVRPIWMLSKLCILKWNCLCVSCVGPSAASC